MSPTSRTLKLLRERGYLAAITEHWNHYAKIRIDLFGFVDVIALREGETLAVQTTSGSNVSKRVHKINASPNLPVMRSAGWRVFVFGWRKNSKGRWECREVDLSAP